MNETVTDAVGAPAAARSYVGSPEEWLHAGPMTPVGPHTICYPAPPSSLSIPDSFHDVLYASQGLKYCHFASTAHLLWLCGLAPCERHSPPSGAALLADTSCRNVLGIQANGTTSR